MGHYALVHITPELISKERQILAETLTPKGAKRSAGTINRYMAVLASTFTYAVKNLRWLSENPCTNLLKVKDNSGRDRILQETEFSQLIKACRESKSPYLYSIVLIALTTGARRGEILGLKWRDIDFDQKIAHFKETKNGKPRSVALSDLVIDALKQVFGCCKRNNPLRLPCQFLIHRRTNYNRVSRMSTTRWVQIAIISRSIVARFAQYCYKKSSEFDRIKKSGKGLKYGA